MKGEYKIKCYNCGHEGILNHAPHGIFNKKVTRCSICGNIGGSVSTNEE